jgi:transcriptional regulator GlxA family with amidase domain
VTPKRTVLVIYDGFQALDLVGPHEVLAHAAELTGGCRCEVVAPSAGPVETIALRCGFGTAESLRRLFHRATRIAPSDYRSWSTREHA